MRQSRRQFLTTATAGLAGILATGTPPARRPAARDLLPVLEQLRPRLGQEARPRSASASPRTPASRSRSTTSRAPQQAAKYASEVQTQAGHDIVEMRMHFPWLYEPQLDRRVRHRRRAREEVRQGASRSAYEGAHVKGVWRAVPQYHAMFVAAYREDLFKKAGLKVPRHLGGALRRRQGAEEDGQSRRHPHQPELRLDLHGAGPCCGRSAAWRSTRTARRSGSTPRHTVADGRVVQEDVSSDCMEPEVLSW